MRATIDTMRNCLISLALLGCSGGAQLVLKSPIQDQCTSAGLKECERIADGATLYADGNATQGRPKLTEGLRANADKISQLKKFADGLALVGKIPGAGQYVAPLQPAIVLVQQVAAEAAARQAAQDQAQAQLAQQERIARSRTQETAQPEPPKVTPPPPLPSSETHFWTVAGNVLARPCRFAGTPRMLCIREPIHARKTVTDVMVSSACPVDVLVSSGQGLNVDWLVYAPAGRGAEVHGASLTLGAERALTVAIAPKSEDTTLDIRCGVTTSWQDDSPEREPPTPAKPAADGI